MNSKKLILILIFLSTVFVYYTNMSFEYYIILSFVFLFFSVYNLFTRFKESVPFGELIALIYFFENVMALVILKLIMNYDIYDTSKFYVQIPITSYLPFGLMATESFLVGYTFLKRPDNLWIHYINNFKNIISFKTLTNLLIFFSIISPILEIANIGALAFVTTIFSKALLCVLIGFYLAGKGRTGNLYLLFGLLINVISTIKTGMFTGLVEFGVMVGLFNVTKINISNRKVNMLLFGFVAVFGIIIVSFLQNLKHDYREEAWLNNNENANTETFYQNFIKNYERADITDKTFYLGSLGRLNQAWLVSCTMEKVPIEQPFVNGETIVTSFTDAILPRVLNPDKQVSGGRVRMDKFTNVYLSGGVSMGIGYLGELYVNFGIIGGIISFGILGIFFAFIEKKALLLSVKDPLILLFAPVYVMTFLTSGNDFFWIFNNLTMGTLILYMIIRYFFKQNVLNLKLDKEKNNIA